MQNLSTIIQELDGLAVSNYSRLCGFYEKNGIRYRIQNVHGGQIKSADIELTFDIQRIYPYEYEKRDEIAISAHILREFQAAVHLANNAMQQSTDKVQKGLFISCSTGTRILSHSSVELQEGILKIFFVLRLPYNQSAYDGSNLEMGNKARQKALANVKKGIISAKALKLFLLKNLPELSERFINEFDATSLEKSILLYRNQEYIRSFLKMNGYVCFVANGSILPRKGKTDYKDAKFAVPFVSPKSMEIIIDLPNAETVCGMGIKAGITLITGDAYHGKSTILEAISQGVYNHAAGDGREYVITDESALQIKAEDGRSIRNTDISFFLRKLPVKSIVADCFSTDNASGSTSQAAAVAEAIEIGSSLMLFDEDRSANNFMYKDEKLRSIIQNASTTPYLDCAKMFYDKYGISSIIVVGASGEYFKIADKVIVVENFKVREYENEGLQVAGTIWEFYFKKRLADLSHLRQLSLDRRVEIKDNLTIKFGSEIADISEIIPCPTRGQLSFICSFLYYLTVFGKGGKVNLIYTVQELYAKIANEGIFFLHQKGFKDTEHIEFVRYQDMLCILYRLRCVSFHKA